VLAFAREHGESLRVAPDAIRAIPSSDYPQPAPRPRNSRLDTAKLRAAFDVTLPPWQAGVDRMLSEILTAGAPRTA
jgi:dTDP-4-dehydrorhamnose reductase